MQTQVSAWANLTLELFKNCIVARGKCTVRKMKSMVRNDMRNESESIQKFLDMQSVRGKMQCIYAFINKNKNCFQESYNNNFCRSFITNLQESNSAPFLHFYSLLHCQKLKTASIQFLYDVSDKEHIHECCVSLFPQLLFISISSC